MKKLTLVLVVLLLALACVFVACGKKNETPVDNTDPKPVDDNPTPAPVDTVTVEDMTPVAEQFKKDLADNYVDLYSKEVENAIDAEKSAALLKIMGASSKDEAQKIADEFFAFLKDQKTSYDVLKDLVAQLEDIALSDADLVKQAAAYKADLDKQYAGNNAAKKEVLDAYKADKDLQKKIDAASDRLVDLEALKEAADEATKGVNAKEIADLKKDFTAENKTFTMKDYDLYEATVAAVETAAKNTAGPKGTGAVKADSKAYAEIFDVETLNEMKALLDAAIAAKPAMADLKAVIDAAAALKVTAEEARYVEKITADKTALATAYAAATPIPVKTSAGRKFVAATVAADADKDNLEEYEIDVAYRDFGITATPIVEFYNFSLKAAVKAADELVKSLDKKYTTNDLKNAGYVAAGEADKAKTYIADLVKAYQDSVKAAQGEYAKFTFTNYVSAKPEKADTEAYFAGFTTAPKNYKVDNALGNQIAAVLATFKTKNASGYEVSAAGYINKGDYTVEDDDSNAYKFYLKDGKAAIAYTAYTYAYTFGNKTLVTTTTSDPTKLEVQVFDVLKAQAKLALAKKAQQWFTIFIGDEEPAEKYDLAELADYNTTYFKGAVLDMTDRDVTEVATAKVTKINGVDQAIEADAATEIKLLAPYTVVNAILAEAKTIADAQAAAEEELKAAVLALREVGEADALAKAVDLYNDIKTGAYVNEKLNGEDADSDNDAYYADTAVTTLTVVVGKDAKGDDVAKSVSALLAQAVKVYDEAIKLVTLIDNSDYDTADENLKANKAAVEALNEYAKKAAAEVARCQAAYNLTTADGDRIVNKTALDGATAVSAKVETLINLLLSADAFTSSNQTTKALKPGDGAAEVGDILKNVSKSGKAYAALNVAIDDEKAEKALYEYIAKVFNKTDDAHKPQDELTNALATEKAALEKAYAEYEFDYKVGTKAKAVDVTNFFKELKAFAADYKADYLNLVVTDTFGETALTFDLFTEAYRQQILINVSAVIGKIKTAADTLTSTTDFIAGEDDTWEPLVTANVNATEVKLEALTSKAAAEKLAAAYTISEATYKLDSVLDLINDGVPTESQTSLEAFKVAAGLTK